MPALERIRTIGILPDPLPPMSDNMVATIMNNAGGKRQAVAAIILKSDLPSAHPQLLNYTVELAKAVEAIKEWSLVQITRSSSGR
jgi:hypothetical protein